MSNKKFKTITSRVEEIKSIIGDGIDTYLASLIDLDDTNNTYDLLNHKFHDCKKNDKCNDSSCILNKKIVNIKNVFKNIDSMDYIKSGTTGHTFKGTIKKLDGEIIYIAIKFVAYTMYDKYGDVYDIRRPENAELAILKVLGKLVLLGQTSHIVLPIGTCNIDLKKFVYSAKKKIQKVKKFNEFVENYENNQYHPIASVLISEWSDGGDLLQYLKNNFKYMKLHDWKILFFQIISTLAVIQEKFPTFRHNDLKPNNILVNLVKVKNEKSNGLVYHIKNQYYIVKNVTFIIKIWDFDFACISGVVDNAKVNAGWTNKINISNIKNRYYDLHYFFNTLTDDSFFPEIFTSDYIDSDVADFIRRVVPKKLASGKGIVKKCRILSNVEHVLPIDLISSDDFFKEFRYTDKEIHDLNIKKIKSKE